MKNEKRITKESGNGLKEPRYDDGVEIRTLEDAATVEAPSNNEFGEEYSNPDWRFRINGVQRLLAP